MRTFLKNPSQNEIPATEGVVLDDDDENDESENDIENEGIEMHQIIVNRQDNNAEIVLIAEKNGNVTAASVTHLSSMISLFGGEENTIIAMSLMLAFCIISIAAVISVVIYCKNKKSRNNGADIETADTEQENAFKLE